MNKTGRYGVEFAKASKGWAGEEDKDSYTHLGAFNSVGVRFDTIEDAETLIRMVHLDELPNVWVITEYGSAGSYQGKTVKMHPLVEKILAKEKGDREARIADNTALAIAMNKQPTERIYKRYPNGAVISLKRTEATYNPKISGNIQLGIRAYVSLPDKRARDSFDLWPNSYITRDDKAQKSKFLNNNAHHFGGQSKERVHYIRHRPYGENREGVYPADMREIADDLLNIRQALKDWEKELYALEA